MSTLHITNGDHAGDMLRRFVDGPVTLACDMLHEGPCPPVDGDAWHKVRGRFLAGRGRPADEITASLAAGDRTILDACNRGERLVLWFEHDLFDQLALIRTLDLVGRVRSDPTSISLICIDRFPGVDRFVGLGQLTPDQLATLTGTGVPMTAGQVGLARDAWRAFRSADPSELVRIAPSSSALPFLGDALLRFAAEYPSVDNGLSRTEELALGALDGGPMSGGALFGDTQRREPVPFMGDWPFFDTLQRLASARVPLVTVETGSDGGEMRSARLALTAAGRDVLARKADHVRLNGNDLWRGGVHLTGSDHSPWRWDGDAERLVSLT